MIKNRDGLFFLFFHEEIYFSSFPAYMDVTILFTIKKLLL